MRARDAQPAWAALGIAGRAEVMLGARRWLIANRRRVVRTLVAETGKPWEDAMNVEIVYVADALGFWARRAGGYLRDERVRAHSPFLLGKRLIIRRRPHGVVGVIGPCNYPLILCFGDAIPALMAGNAAVLKPSELTPLSTQLMAEGMLEAGLPEHVMPVLLGPAETGAALVDAVDMVQFTGSTATGKRVMARAAETLTPVSLELGGKDPMIVLADADLDRAADAACWYGLCNAGQSCWSVERVYVEAPAYQPFVDCLLARVLALRAGTPNGPGTVELGALGSETQVQIVEEHVEGARQRGAHVLAGGSREPRGGHFYKPTILLDVDHHMRAMREETFGPTLPVMRVADADEAVALANDSAYGLNSSVWTHDRRRGEQIARRLTSGNACVNDAVLSALALELPFGAAGAPASAPATAPRASARRDRPGHGMQLRIGRGQHAIAMPVKKRPQLLGVHPRVARPGAAQTALRTSEARLLQTDERLEVNHGRAPHKMARAASGSVRPARPRLSKASSTLRWRRRPRISLSARVTARPAGISSVSYTVSSNVWSTGTSAGSTMIPGRVRAESASESSSTSIHNVPLGFATTGIVDDLIPGAKRARTSTSDAFSSHART